MKMTGNKKMSHQQKHRISVFEFGQPGWISEVTKEGQKKNKTMSEVGCHEEGWEKMSLKIDS